MQPPSKLPSQHPSRHPPQQRSQQPSQRALFADSEQQLDQASSTSASAADAPVEYDLQPGVVREYRRFFSATEADELLEQLLAEVPWRQDRIFMMGRELDVPRLQCWMADPGLSYSYSGMRLQPSPWIGPVDRIRQAVMDLTGYHFNSVLLNQYRNGNDSVSWHADDEPELGPNPVIASVSLGVSRRFQLKPKAESSAGDDSRRVRFELHHGSLLLMGNTIQNNWLHQVPKQKTIDSPRVNLTFRLIEQV